MEGEQKSNLWAQRLAARAREREELKALGYKDSEIDQLFWDRARYGNNGRQMHIGEISLHIEAPEDPRWPDVELPDDPPELKKG